MAIGFKNWAWKTEAINDFGGLLSMGELWYALGARTVEGEHDCYTTWKDGVLGFTWISSHLHLLKSKFHHPEPATLRMPTPRDRI